MRTPRELIQHTFQVRPISFTCRLHVHPTLDRAGEWSEELERTVATETKLRLLVRTQPTTGLAVNTLRPVARFRGLGTGVQSGSATS